jgi:hypothetical protein
MAMTRFSADRVEELHMASSAESDMAWSEFNATGTVGATSIRLLLKLTGQLVARSSFPPPPQHHSWNDEAILDFIGGMVAGKGGTDFIVAAALKSRDQRSFERLLQASVENWLKDQAKMTVVGRMRRRLVTLLGGDSRFIRASTVVGADAWTLAEFDVAVWQGDEVDLFQRTRRSSDNGLTELNVAGKTSAKNVSILVGYCHHVLAMALGALRDQLIARFVVRRYELDEAFAVELYEATTDLNNENSVEEQMLVFDLRDSLLDLLYAREQVVLALWEHIEKLAERLNLSVAEAELEVSMLFDRLRPLAFRTNTGRKALMLVIEECAKRL